MPAYNLYSPKELFFRLSQGDSLALKSIFEQYHLSLFRFIAAIVKSDAVAEELVQDIFMKLWEKRSVLDGIDQPDHYLFSMARNKGIDYLRKIAAEDKLVKALWQNIHTAQTGAEETIALNERNQLIGKALASLSQQKQKIFELSRYENFSHDEIASQLKLSKNTVKNNLVDILKHIRTFLTPHYTTRF